MSTQLHPAAPFTVTFIKGSGFHAHDNAWRHLTMDLAAAEIEAGNRVVYVHGAAATIDQRLGVSKGNFPTHNGVRITRKEDLPHIRMGMLDARGLIAGELYKRQMTASDPGSIAVGYKAPEPYGYVAVVNGIRLGPLVEAMMKNPLTLVTPFCDQDGQFLNADADHVAYAAAVALATVEQVANVELNFISSASDGGVTKHRICDYLAASNSPVLSSVIGKTEIDARIASIRQVTARNVPKEVAVTPLALVP